MDRSKIIIRTGLIGIAANVLLAAFKAAVGLLTHSIAITLDAVNNLSDVLSSVITIIGTKLAGKRPDKNHPFGHGRFEYLSATAIAVLVLYAGITALIESVKKIILPETPEYTPVALLIIAAAVLVKIALGLYVRAAGVRVSSEALIASGKDALLDALISASTLAAAGIYLLFHISLEAWLAAVISLIIIRSGVGMLRESVSYIVGRRADKSVADSLALTVLGFDEVRGVYDIVLHSYGPETLIGSVHIEVRDDMTVTELDKLERQIADRVYAENRVMLTGISVYADHSDDDRALAVMGQVRKIVMRHEHVLQMHGFILLEEEREMRFDVVIGFDCPDRQELFDQIVAEVQAAYPDYRLLAVLDSDMAG